MTSLAFGQRIVLQDEQYVLGAIPRDFHLDLAHFVSYP